MTVTLTDVQIARGPRHSQLRRYFATARERHALFQRRFAGRPPPWTNDPIFQRYRFTNVYRELDKVTTWLRKSWQEPYSDHRNLAFAMALARLINWPPTLEEIGFPHRWNPDQVVGMIKVRQAKGEKVYTGAYLLGAVPKGVTRADYLIYSVLTPLYRKLRHSVVPPNTSFGNSLEEVWKWFRNQPGIGDFLAYEIVTDLCHTRYLYRASDKSTWANAGPGALRGLTRLWGYQPKTKREDGYTFPKRHANDAMRLLLEKSREYIPHEIPAWEMREVEQWCCEQDKYLRIMKGQGVLERFIPKDPGEW